MIKANLKRHFLAAISFIALAAGASCSKNEMGSPASSASSASETAQVRALPADYHLCDQENKFLNPLVGMSFAQASKTLTSYGFTTKPLNATNNAEQWQEGISCERESCRAHLFLRGDAGQAITLDVDSPSQSAKVTGAWGQAYPGQCGTRVG